MNVLIIFNYYVIITFMREFVMQFPSCAIGGAIE